MNVAASAEGGGGGDRPGLRERERERAVCVGGEGVVLSVVSDTPC